MSTLLTAIFLVERSETSRFIIPVNSVLTHLKMDDFTCPKGLIVWKETGSISDHLQLFPCCPLQRGGWSRAAHPCCSLSSSRYAGHTTQSEPTVFTQQQPLCWTPWEETEWPLSVISAAAAVSWEVRTQIMTFPLRDLKQTRLGRLGSLPSLFAGSLRPTEEEGYSFLE